MAFRCLAHNKRNAKAKICIQIHLCVEPKQTELYHTVSNRAKSSWVQLGWVKIASAELKSDDCATFCCAWQTLCVCVCVLSIWVSGLRTLILIQTLKSGFCLFVRSCVHLSARGVPINCPNVQTSFVMRITKIEANHFANRILISNVSDSAVIRWICYRGRLRERGGPGPFSGSDSGWAWRRFCWVYRSPTIYVNFCVFAASGVWNYAMPLLIYWRAKWELVLETYDDSKRFSINIKSPNRKSIAYIFGRRMIFRYCQKVGNISDLPSDIDSTKSIPIIPNI